MYPSYTSIYHAIPSYDGICEYMSGYQGVRIPDANAHTFFTFDIVYRYRRYSIRIDIKCHTTRFRRWHTVDIEGHEKDCRYRSLVSSISIKHPSISYNDIVYDIEDLSHVRYQRFCYIISGSIIMTRYRIRYSIHPMSFTAERKLPLRRRHHAAAEESQRHKPWIPAPSFCAIPQLDDDEPWSTEIWRGKVLP
jgi:hypothetical protein